MFSTQDIAALKHVTSEHTSINWCTYNMNSIQFLIFLLGSHREVDFLISK